MTGTVGPGGRATLANGLGLAAVAVSSGGQVALFLHFFGAGDRTDGVIAGLAVYSVAAILAQLLRTSTAPLVLGEEPRLGGPLFAWATVVLATGALLVTLLLAGPLGRAITPGLGEQGQELCVSALRILSVPIGLQLVGAALAVECARRGRLRDVGLAYGASAAAALVAFVALRPAAGELGLAWALLAASVVLVAGLLGPVRPALRRPPPPAALGRAALLVVGSALLPLTFYELYPVTLLLLGDAGPGEITVFGLAFVLCSYLPGLTAVVFGTSDVVAHSGASEGGSALVLRAFRWSLLLVLPPLCVGVLLGTPVVRLLVPDRLPAGADLGRYLLLLGPWLVATVLLWSALPALLARRRPVELAWWVPGIVLVHVAAGLAGRALAGVDGVVLATAAAPGIFAVLALRAAGVPGVAGGLVRDGTALCVLAAAAWGGTALAARELGGDGAGWSVLAAVGGTALYAAGLRALRVRPWSAPPVAVERRPAVRA